MGSSDAAGAAGGRLLLAAAPLGNAGDASTRLRDALARVPVIAAEDTRRVRRLCADLGVTPAGRMVSFFEANEAARMPQLLAALRDGQDVLVVTDAGMPSVSDPGYRLVVAAVDQGVVVSVLPGPSAVTAALAVSGLATDRFCFEGFLPRRAGERRARLAALAVEDRTLVLFEAPHRLAATLEDMAATFGESRRAVVCRELTKTYEEVIRAPLGDLSRWSAEGNVRGEITLVVAGADRSATGEPAAPDELAASVADRERAGATRKDAIAAVARERGVPKRTVYDAVVAAKRPG